MARLASAALLLPFLAAASPAAAQLATNFSSDASENRWKIPVEAEPPIASSGLSLPVISYTAPDGSLQLKRGIIAGVRVAPNANVGIGLFETLPKTRGLKAPDNPMEHKPKRSRKAAVGFSLKF